MISTLDPILNGYGLAGLVIAVLSGVVIYLYKEGKAKDKKYDDLQERRLQEAKDTYTKLTEPLDEQRSISQKMYDILVNIRDRRDS